MNADNPYQSPEGPSDADADDDPLDSSGVVVGTFATEFEAENARLALEASGIVATVEDTHLVTTLWHYGTAFGGAKVRVPAELAERATAILAELRDHPASETAAWFCRECREKVEAGFDRCWSCGKLREEVEQKSPSTTAPAKPSDDEEEGRSEWAERTAQRALKAAVIGLVFLPILMHLYSIFLLIRLEPYAFRLSPRDRRRCWQAWAINVAVLVGICAFILILTW